MTWVRSFEDCLPGKGADLIMRDLYDRDNDLYELGVSASHFTRSIPSAGAGWVTVNTYRHKLPPYVRSGDTIRLTVWAEGGNVGNEHQIRLNGDDGTTSTTGSAVSYAHTTTPQPLRCTVDVQASWVESYVDLTLEANHDSGATDSMAVGTSFIVTPLSFTRQAE